MRKRRGNVPLKLPEALRRDHGYLEGEPYYEVSDDANDETSGRNDVVSAVCQLLSCRQGHGLSGKWLCYWQSLHSIVYQTEETNESYFFPEEARIFDRLESRILLVDIY